jgi:hypothetical protein
MEEVTRLKALAKFKRKKPAGTRRVTHFVTFLTLLTF